MDPSRRKLAVSLFEIDCLLFGNILLPSGIYVTAYFDLGAIFSHPQLLNRMCDIACEYLEKKKIFPSSICGVSYSGIPFAAVISNKLRVPLFLRTKEINFCAEDLTILGDIRPNSEVTVIEEVVCSGASTLQVIKDIENAGMKVKNVFFMVDLEQGGFESLRKLGYCPLALYKLSEIRDSLFDDGYLNEEQVGDIRRGWMNQHVLSGDCMTDTTLAERLSTKYEYRLEYMKLPVAQKLLHIMLEKKTNLCVDLSLGSIDEIIETIDVIGPHVCIVALHLDSFDKPTKNQIHALKRMASLHNLLLMDDRKLSATGFVLLHQLRNILSIVDLVTILPLFGNNVSKEVNAVADEMPDKGVFFVGSSLNQNSFVKTSFENDVIRIGLAQNRSLVGFIAHQNSRIPLTYLHMMSDLRNTGSSVEKTNSYYSLDVMSGMLGADVVISYFSSTSNILNLVKEQVRTSWEGYENRFCLKIKKAT